MLFTYNISKDITVLSFKTLQLANKITKNYKHQQADRMV